MSLSTNTSDFELFKVWKLQCVPEGNSQIHPDHSAPPSSPTILGLTHALERERDSTRDLLYQAANLHTQLRLAEARLQWVKKDYEILCRAVNSKAVVGHWPSSPSENPYAFRWSHRGDNSPLDVQHGCGCSTTINPAILTPPPYTPAPPMQSSAADTASMPPPPKRKADVPLEASTKRATLHGLVTEIPDRPISPKAMFSPITPKTMFRPLTPQAMFSPVTPKVSFRPTTPQAMCSPIRSTHV
ncbi:hypothetical protein ACEPPN_000327 [Leptodophora sp. 'Broadleaf-Isolate-01']